MSYMYERRDITDEVWAILEPHLPGCKDHGRHCKDNRRFINGVYLILRTGALWRDLPPTYGD